jgi:hypothetical protein
MPVDLSTYFLRSNSDVPKIHHHLTLFWKKKCQNTVSPAVILSRIACRKSCILKRYINTAALPISIYQNLHHLSHYFTVYDNTRIYVRCYCVLSPYLAANSLKLWTTTYRFLLAKPQDCVLQLILPHFTFFPASKATKLILRIGAYLAN